jgi:xylulokinase
LILTIDIGSSSLKGALITPAGKIFSYHRIPFSHFFRTREAIHWVSAFKTLVSLLPDKNITAVSISGNGPTLVPLNKKDTLTGPVLFWRDNPPIAGIESFFLPGIIDFRQNRPDQWKETTSFLPTAEFFCWMLTGEKKASSPHTGFNSKMWAVPELEKHNIDPLLLPPLTDYRLPIGEIGKDAASRWDLPVGIPVFSPGSDYIASLLGTNTLAHGKVCDRAGSSEGINYCSLTRTNNVKLRSIPHLIPELYNTAALLFQTGYCFEQFKTSLGYGNTGYNELMKGIIVRKPDIDDLLFIHNAPDNEQFHGMKESYDPLERMTAIVRCIAFAFRQGIELLEKDGLPLKRITISGGQAKNRYWNQFKADISGKTLDQPEITDSELAGCAVLALTGMTRNQTLEQTASEIVRTTISYCPDPEIKKAYTPLYERWLSLTSTTTSSF